MPDISTIGSDPEFFIVHNDGSSVGLPIASWEMNNYEGFEEFNLEPDNAAFEIHPEPVAYEDFVPYYLDLQENFNNVFRSRFPQANYGRQSIDLREHHLNHPRANQIGCQPFKTIWDVKQCEIALKPEQLNGRRTAGGHIWMGIEDAQFIKCLDATIGLWQTMQNLNRRRYELYGRAGAYKQRDGLLEYRTLGNWWMFYPSIDSGIVTIKHQMDRALHIFNSDKQRMFVESKGADIQRAINTNDVRLAEILYVDIRNYKSKGKTSKKKRVKQDSVAVADRFFTEEGLSISVNEHITWDETDMSQIRMGMPVELLQVPSRWGPHDASDT